MNQMRYKVNESAPFDVIFTPEQIMGDRRNYSIFNDKMPGFDPNKYYDLHDILKNVVGSDEPKYTTVQENGDAINLVPTHHFSVPVDVNTVRSNGTVHPGDSVVSELHIDIPADKRLLVKNDLAMLAVIATSKWQRPICFTSPQDLATSACSNTPGCGGLPTSSFRWRIPIATMPTPLIMMPPIRRLWRNLPLATPPRPESTMMKRTGATSIR